MSGLTNHGFEYSVNIGGAEDTDVQTVDTIHQVGDLNRHFISEIISLLNFQEAFNTSKPRGIIESMIEHDRTIEFNNSKESTMI